MTTLPAKLRVALSKATPQNPVDTKTLSALGTHKNVVAALLAMQDAREVGCCEITTKGIKRVVWWPTGIVQPSKTSDRFHAKQGIFIVMQKTKDKDKLKAKKALAEVDEL